MVISVKSVLVNKKIQVQSTWIFYCFKVNDHAEECLNDLFPL